MHRIAIPLAAALFAWVAWVVVAHGAAADESGERSPPADSLLTGVIRPGDRFELPPLMPQGIRISLLSDEEVRRKEAERQEFLRRAAELEAEHPWLKDEERVIPGERFEISREHNQAKLKADLIDVYTVERIGRDYLAYRRNEDGDDEIVYLPLHAIIAVTERTERLEARNRSE